MFSEILKTISLENAPKCDLLVGFGRLSFAANVRLPNSKSHFGAAGHVPAGGARWTLLSRVLVVWAAADFATSSPLWFQLPCTWVFFQSIDETELYGLKKDSCKLMKNSRRSSGGKFAEPTFTFFVSIKIVNFKVL